jgi:hypothetical protein
VISSIVRRSFLTALGGAAAPALLRPRVARAQRRRPRIAVLSLNTAQDEGKIQLGLSIPAALLNRADEVIE